MRWVAATPPMPGMRASISTTSGAAAGHELEGGLAGGGLAHHEHVLGLRQDAAEALAHDRVVVHDEAADAPRRPVAAESRLRWSLAVVLPRPLGRVGRREWAILDSNQGPHPYQRCALTA